MHQPPPMYQRDTRSNSFSPYGKVRKSPLDNYKPYTLRSPNMNAKGYATVRSNGKILEHLDIQQKFENYNKSFENCNDKQNVDILGEDKNSRYKTEMCRNFKERAHCMYGDQCQFAHGREELRDALRNNKYKTKTCQKYWVTGYCAYGPRCNFLHFENGENCDSTSNIASSNQLQTEMWKHTISFSSEEKSNATSDEELAETVDELERAILNQMERDKTICSPNLEDLLQKLKKALPPKRSSTPLLDISKSNGSSASDISRTSPLAIENDTFGDQFNSNWIYGDGIVKEHGSFESRENTLIKNCCDQRVLETFGLSKSARGRDIFSLISACSKENTSPNNMITQ